MRSMTEKQNCDVCPAKELDEVVDGATKPAGRWGNMCMTCFKAIGKGLGTGLGQRYVWKDEKYTKVEG